MRITTLHQLDVMSRLNEIASQHFNNPDLQLSRETVAADVPGWDSLAHIQFLMQIENSFKIRFKSSEVSSFANVGQLADRIEARLNA